MSQAPTLGTGPARSCVTASLLRMNASHLVAFHNNTYTKSKILKTLRFMISVPVSYYPHGMTSAIDECSYVMGRCGDA